MWDPLENNCPDASLGLTWMLVIHELNGYPDTFQPSTLGHNLVRDLWSAIRVSYTHINCHEISAFLLHGTPVVQGCNFDSAYTNRDTACIVRAIPLPRSWINWPLYLKCMMYYMYTQSSHTSMVRIMRNVG
uniref:Protein V2 n=1 Tax=African cassava mosaic virus-cotton TaxID=685973 RepID=F0UXL5_9GEMI|nr:AV2 [African cassava mosaic virus-cotton]